MADNHRSMICEYDAYGSIVNRCSISLDGTVLAAPGFSEGIASGAGLAGIFPPSADATAEPPHHLSFR